MVGIDIGKLCITRARNQQSKLGGHSARIQFEVADAWDMSALQRYEIDPFKPLQADCVHNARSLLTVHFLICRLDPVFDTIYIDVGGLSGADGEFRILLITMSLRFAA